MQLGNDCMLVSFCTQGKDKLDSLTSIHLFVLLIRLMRSFLWRCRGDRNTVTWGDLEAGRWGEGVPLPNAVLHRQNSTVLTVCNVIQLAVSSTKKKATRHCPQTKIFEEEGEPKKRIRTPVCLLTFRHIALHGPFWLSPPGLNSMISGLDGDCTNLIRLQKSAAV